MRAFTLLESLIYIALFGLVMSGGLAGVQALTASAERSQTQALLETEGSFLLKKVGYEIVHSQNIAEPGNTSSSTELSVTNDLDNPVEVYLADGVLMRTERTVPLPLSTNSVSVSNLSFLRSGSRFTSVQSVQISFDISSLTDDGRLVSEHFMATSYVSP